MCRSKERIVFKKKKRERNGREQNVTKQRLSLLACGIAIGFINGFLGGGGGILVVTVLLTVLKIPQQKAHATALWVILPLSLVSAVFYVLTGSVDWFCTLFVTIGVVAGGVTGALLLKKSNDIFLKLLFSVVMIAAGVRMLL